MRCECADRCDVNITRRDVVMEDSSVEGKKGRCNITRQVVGVQTAEM